MPSVDQNDRNFPVVEFQQFTVTVDVDHVERPRVPRFLGHTVDYVGDGLFRFIAQVATYAIHKSHCVYRVSSVSRHGFAYARNPVDASSTGVCDL